MSIRAWEEIVREIERESDPCKLKELAKTLNELMLADERETRERR